MSVDQLLEKITFIMTWTSFSIFYLTYVTERGIPEWVLYYNLFGTGSNYQVLFNKCCAHVIFRLAYVDFLSEIYYLG